MNIELLLTAIMMVESGGNPNAVGDQGRSIGPYQIQRAYWQDSGVAGNYRMCRNKTYARRVVLAYWKRHCPRALASRDFKTLARIHNGGPSGHRNSATIRYWNKVQMHMKGSRCKR